MRRLALVLVLLVAAGAGAAWWYGGAGAAAPPAYVTAAAEIADLENAVTALGTVEPFQSVEVGTQVSGQIRRLSVQIGQEVKAGDLLAEIDPTVYQARVAADRADLQSLQAQLGQRQAELTLAGQQYRRQSDLLQADATSREAYESAAASVQIAEAQIAVLQAGIAKAQSTLAGDEASLGYTRITAPMDGTVMSLSVRQGQTVNANQSAPVILEIADLEIMTVRTQVSEADVGKLRLDMDAYFTTLGDPDRRWIGRLRQILPTPEVENNVVLYNALFEVANPDRRLMPQMTAQVFFVADRAEHAVLVPLAALQEAPEAGGAADTGDGRTADRATVRVLAGGRVESRDVTVGVRNRVSAQILSGLEPGEQVVVGDAAAEDAPARPRPRSPFGF